MACTTGLASIVGATGAVETGVGAGCVVCRWSTAQASGAGSVIAGEASGVTVDAATGGEVLGTCALDALLNCCSQCVSSDT